MAGGVQNLVGGLGYGGSKGLFKRSLAVNFELWRFYNPGHVFCLWIGTDGLKTSIVCRCRGVCVNCFQLALKFPSEKALR